MFDVHRAVLTCQWCAADTLHEIRYLGRLLAGVRCTKCDTEISQADPGRYLGDLRHRLVTKPRRLLRRLVHDPGEFVRTQPVAALIKPLKMMRELAAVVQAVDARTSPMPVRGREAAGGQE
ncbi:hypothetical protein [Nonomuraea sp. 10N515B]|uniref:hypothetical protein n=1 Tax=Nonomuraea sp. 10N515B TaxID=3457422 RepID=UPI003FCC8BA6